MLAAAVEDAGAVAFRRLWVADDVPTFLSTLDAEVDAGVDLILTSGGVSAGAYEVVKEALAPRGVEFTKVALQPGMPQGSGRYGDTAVVCLPGNPVSSLVSFEVFVRPALRASYGHPRPGRPVVAARSPKPWTRPPASASSDGASWTATPAPSSLRPGRIGLPRLARPRRLPHRRPG